MLRTREVRKMNYEKCWEKLKYKLKEIRFKSQSDKDGWVSIITADTMLSLLQKIEREVQDEEQR